MPASRKRKTATTKPTPVEEEKTIEEQPSIGSDWIPQTPDKNDENRPNKKAEIREKNLPTYTTQRSAELIALANFENVEEANTFFGGEYAKKVGTFSKRRYSERDLNVARIMCDMVVLCEDRVEVSESAEKAKDNEQEAAQEIELAENGLVIENSTESATPPPSEHFYVTSNLFTDHSNQIKHMHLNNKIENYLNPNNLNPYTVIQLPYSSAKYMPLFLKYVTFGLLDEQELELFDIEERRDFYLNIFWLKSIFFCDAPNHKKYHYLSNFEYWKKVGILWCPNREWSPNPDDPKITKPFSCFSEEEILEKEGTKWWDLVYNADVLIQMQGNSELFIELSEKEKNKRAKKGRNRIASKYRNTCRNKENADTINNEEEKDEKDQVEVEKDEKEAPAEPTCKNPYKSTLHHCTNPKTLNFLTYKVNQKGPIKKSKHLAKLAEDVANKRIKIIDLKLDGIISEEDYEHFEKLVKNAETKKAKQENKVANVQRQLEQERKNFINKIEKLKAEHKTKNENILKSHAEQMKAKSNKVNNLKRAQVKSDNSGTSPAKRPFQQPQQRQPIQMMAQPVQQMMQPQPMNQMMQPQPMNPEMLQRQMNAMQMQMNQMQHMMQGQQQRPNGWSGFGQN